MLKYLIHHAFVFEVDETYFVRFLYFDLPSLAHRKALIKPLEGLVVFSAARRVPAKCFHQYRFL